MLGELGIVGLCVRVSRLQFAMCLWFICLLPFVCALQIILAFGNYVNSAKRGSAYGFKLQSLDMVIYEHN